MNVLISGGTGLVGTEIGKALASEGHKLFVLTRSPEKANKYCPFPQTPISWDELDNHPSLASMDAIINLAGTSIFESRWNKKIKESIRNSRIQCTKKLVETANRHCKKLSCFVSTSAIGIYGEADDHPVSEDDSLSYNFLGKVCQDWEAPLGDLKNGRSVVLRVGIVLSEKGGALEQMVPPIQSGLGGPLGSGKQFMSWIDMDDLVDIYRFAIENPIQGVFNAVAPNPVTNKELTDTIAGHLGVSASLPVPYAALRVALGEVAPHLVESQTISSQKIQNKGFSFKYKKVRDSIEKRVPQLKGTQRRFIFEQWIPAQKDEVFKFFSAAENLEEITPPFLNFHVLKVSTEQLQSGTLLDYKLKLDGIPLRWRTLIKDWNPPHMFSDTQEKGPYKLWYHIHTFEDLAEGTLMTDQIDLQLPLGTLGHLTASWKVFRDVQKIFDYRRQIIEKLQFN